LHEIFEFLYFNLQFMKYCFLGRGEYIILLRLYETLCLAIGLRDHNQSYLGKQVVLVAMISGEPFFRSINYFNKNTPSHISII
jgi:hypothetical protein